MYSAQILSPLLGGMEKEATQPSIKEDWFPWLHSEGEKLLLGKTGQPPPEAAKPSLSTDS